MESIGSWSIIVLVIVQCYVTEVTASCQNEKVPSSHVTVTASNGSISYGLLQSDSSGWCSNIHDPSPYIQFDFDVDFLLCRFLTYGSKNSNNWVRSYKVNTRTPGNTTWTTYQENGIDRIFSANADSNTSISRYVANGWLQARHLRVIPLTWYKDFPCMRLQLYGVRENPANVAKGKTVTSSGHSNIGGNLSEVTDGNYSTCVKTEGIVDLSIAVDLGSNMLIGEIKIATGESENNKLEERFEIYVDNNKCDGLFKVRKNEAIVVECTPSLQYGRKVMIKPIAYPALIFLCELEVVVRENYATSANQAYLTNSTDANKTIDGNLTECAVGRSQAVTTPYFNLTFGSNFEFTEFCLVGKDDLLRDFALRTKAADKYQMVRSDDVVAKQCYMTYGFITSTKEIHIQKSTNSTLGLCEIEIYRSNRPCSRTSLGLWTDYKYGVDDAKLSATSGNATNARLLNTNGAWQPSLNDTTPYIQADLAYGAYLCAIATQGHPSNEHWTSTYRVEISLDNVIYEKVDGGKVFTGNFEKNTIVKNIFTRSYKANFVRIYPLTNNTRAAIRFDLFGIPLDCGRMATMTFSGPDGGTLYSSNPFCKGIAEKYFEIQIRVVEKKAGELSQKQISENYAVLGISTQGGPDSDTWVTSYSLKYRQGKSYSAIYRWFDYKHDNGSIAIFQGNWDRNSVRINFLEKPFLTDNIRFYPKSTHNSSNWCVRIDVRVCPNGDSEQPKMNDIGQHMSPLAIPGHVKFTCTSKGNVEVQHEWLYDSGNWVVKDKNETTVDSTSGIDTTTTTYTKYYNTCSAFLADYQCLPRASPQSTFVCVSKMYRFCQVHTTLRLPNQYQQKIIRPNFNLRLPNISSNGVVSNLLPTSFHYRFETHHVRKAGEASILVLEYIVNITDTKDNTTSSYTLALGNMDIDFTGLKFLTNYTVGVTAKGCVFEGSTYERLIRTSDFVRLFWKNQTLTLHEQSATACLEISSDTGNTDIGASCNVTLTPSTATAGRDYTATKSFPVNIAAGGGGQNVCVPIINDELPEVKYETFTLTLHCDDENITTMVTNNVATVTIGNDDAVIGWDSSLQVSLQEQSGCVEFTLRKSKGHVAVPLTVRVKTVAVSATAGQQPCHTPCDFVSVDRNVTFQHDEYVKNISICLTEDDIAEESQTFRIEITTEYPHMITVNPATIKVTIVDNDQVTFGFEKANTAVQERDGYVTFCVYKFGSNDFPISVRLLFLDGPVLWTAEMGKDFSDELNGTLLTFQPNVEQICRNLTIHPDGQAEGDEVFCFQLDCLDTKICGLHPRQLFIVRINDKIDMEHHAALQEQRERDGSASLKIVLYLLITATCCVVVTIIFVLVIFCCFLSKSV